MLASFKGLINKRSSSSFSMALQAGVDLGLLYNTPPSLSIPFSLSLSVRLFPSFSGPWTCNPAISFFCLPLRLVAYSFPYIFFFWDCGVLHSFYMTKPSYSLAFNKPDNVLPLNPLNPILNPICCLLALLAHHFLHVSRIRVKSLTFRRLMSIYIWSTHS